MDQLSLRVGNLLVGNLPNACGLETTFIGPDIEFSQDAIFAVTGARFDLRLNGTRVPMWVAHRATRGDRLSCGDAQQGVRSYICIAGGIDVTPLLGSRSTYLLATFGGVDGRRLITGDELAIGDVPVQDVGYRLKGPHSEIQRTRTAFRRLLGSVERCRCEIQVGSIQVPGGLEAILLMRDAVTGGGYATICTVIQRDLDRVAQLPPGAKIRMREVTNRRGYCAAQQVRRSAQLNRAVDRGFRPSGSTRPIGLTRSTQTDFDWWIRTAGRFSLCSDQIRSKHRGCKLWPPTRELPAIDI